MPALSERHVLEVTALHISGCSVSGIARLYGTSRKTVEKHAARRWDTIRAAGFHNNTDAFVEAWLPTKKKATIDKRTADGAAGLLGGADNKPKRQP